MLVEKLRQSTGRIGYRTIVDTVIEAIAARDVVAGQKLPPQRYLAQDIGVAVATVGRAYAELEAQGFINSHVGRGTFISFHSRQGKEIEPSASDPIELGVYRAPVPRVGHGLADILITIAGTPQAEAILGSAPTAGLSHHREMVGQWLKRFGIDADPSDIVLTNGGQHAVMAALSSLTDHGTHIATEELTDPRMKAVASFLGRGLIGVACDEDGMLPVGDHAPSLAHGARIGPEKCVFIYNANKNRFVDNRFEGCEIGIHFTAGSEGNEMVGNAFIGNRNQVKYVGTRYLDWSKNGRGNFWSDNPAFDLNGDGIADAAYRPNDIIDKVLWTAPEAKVLVNSPAVQIIRWAQARFPAMLPGGVVDTHPLMAPTPLPAQNYGEGARP